MRAASATGTMTEDGRSSKGSLLRAESQGDGLSPCLGSARGHDHPRAYAPWAAPGAASSDSAGRTAPPTTPPATAPYNNTPRSRSPHRRGPAPTSLPPSGCSAPPSPKLAARRAEREALTASRHPLPARSEVEQDVCSAEPGRQVVPRRPFAECRGAGLSKHKVAATFAPASPDGAPAAVACDGVVVLAPVDFWAVGRVQQSAPPTTLLVLSRTGSELGRSSTSASRRGVCCHRGLR